jgi:stage II sporulation protein R
MRKVIVFMLIGISLFTLTKRKEEILIPDAAIRFRVIANSDEKADQDIKMLVKNDIESEVLNDIKTSKSINETRTIINDNLPHYEEVVFNTLHKNNINQSFNINYGINHFPEKEYKGVRYDEGEYESLVVTLGEGKGKNWWCVLFPPLCLLDAKETKEKDKVEYKFFVKELIDKYFK